MLLWNNLPDDIRQHYWQWSANPWTHNRSTFRKTVCCRIQTCLHMMPNTTGRVIVVMFHWEISQLIGLRPKQGSPWMKAFVSQTPTLRQPRRCTLSAKNKLWRSIADFLTKKQQRTEDASTLSTSSRVFGIYVPMELDEIKCSIARRRARSAIQDTLFQANMAQNVI